MTKPHISILNISLTSGGAEKVISLLLKELVNDYNVTLVLFYNEIHFDIPKGVKTVILNKKKPSQPFYLKIFQSIGFLFKYNRLLKQEQVDLAVSFLAFPNLINGIAAVLNPKIKMFVSERGFPSDNTTSKLSLFISKLFYPLLYNRCYKLFSNSVYINKDLAKNFNIKIPMEVIYNPIELPKKKVDSQKYASRIGPLKIINVGSLNARKNQSIIIEAMGKEHELTILGDGPHRQILERAAIQNKMEKKIHLNGKVKNVNNHLVENDCFVLSSNTEGFPNALLEAMAVGLPSISTNCLSGPLELLNDNEPVEIANGDFYKGKYGILVNTNDVAGLAKALDHFFQNPLELEHYSKLSLERAKEYELKSIYGKFKEFLNN